VPRSLKILTATVLIGRTISHFQILAKIGEGGMGIVYKAEDVRLGRPVALKILPADVSGDEERRARLIQEARTGAAASHPNIAAVCEIDEADGVTFIAMEYVEGKTLRALLASRSLSIKEALRIAAEIAEGLAGAHQARIVHRDLKPENVAIAAEGRIKLLDFGLAKLLEQPGDVTPLEASRLETISADRTRESRMVGTVAYMSPEQSRGQALDARSDLFSFGIVLYEMVTGRTPFQGETLLDTVSAILREPAVPAIDLNPEVPSELQRILGKCLEKDAADRYQDTRDLVVDLKRLIRDSDPGPAHRRGVSMTGTAWKAKRPWRLGLVLSLAAASIVAGVGLVWFPRLRGSGESGLAPKPEVALRQLTANPVENSLDAMALSPDGKYLAYVDQSELGLLSIETGERRPLWRAATTVYQISWFPDGTRFLMDKGASSIWSYSVLTGAQRKLRDDGYPFSVSPDGSLVAFVHGAGEIWIMRADGSEARGITRPDKDRSVSNLTWSPDGRRIAYLESSKGEDVLKCTDLQGRETTILPGGGTPPIVSLCWIADGRIVFSRSWRSSSQPGNSLWGIEVEAASGLPEGAPRKITETTGFWWQALSASADGKRMVFANTRSEADVYVGDLQGDGGRLAQPRRLTLDDRDDVLSGWTSDGRSVLFASDRNGSLDLFKQGLDDRSAESVLGGQDEELGAITGPNEAGILFWQAQVKEGVMQAGRLMRLAPGGGPPEMVLDAGTEPLAVRVKCAARSCVVAERPQPDQVVFSALDPVKGKQGPLAKIDLEPGGIYDFWDLSPDGSSVVLVEYQGRVRIVSLASGRVREIPVKEWSYFQNVAWSHDGRSLFVTSWSGNQIVLLRVTLDGQATPLWTECPGFMFRLAPSPDGRHLALGVQSFASNAWMIENF